MSQGTTTSTGTPTLPGGFDIGNFGGLGLFGGIGIFIAILLINWKMNGTKSIAKGLQAFQKQKDVAIQPITANDQKEDTLKIVVEQKEKLADDKQQKINDVISKAATDIKSAMDENDPQVTVNHIIANWKG